jgi:hypothetical protein
LIVIDHLDAREPEFASPSGEVVLPLTALVMMPHLMAGRLPHIDIRVPFEMFLGEPVIHGQGSPGL